MLSLFDIFTHDSHIMAGSYRDTLTDIALLGFLRGLDLFSHRFLEFGFHFNSNLTLVLLYRVVIGAYNLACGFPRYDLKVSVTLFLFRKVTLLTQILI